MWLLVARAPPPDAAYWPGRRWLAAVDALAWPLLWVLLFRQATVPVGIVAPAVVALAALSSTGRLYRALWTNDRYRFTTWRPWGRVVVVLLPISAMHWRDA